MIETTYYNVEQMVPNSPEGVGVWGWTCITHNDKMTDRAEAEAKMAEEMAGWEKYLAQEQERVAEGSEEARDYIAKLQANVEFRAWFCMSNVPHLGLGFAL